MTDRELGKVGMIKPIRKTAEKIRRKFDETFKREAVNNWLSSGKPAEVIAQELGIKAERLYSWRRCFAPADAGVELPRRRRQSLDHVSKSPASTWRGMIRMVRKEEKSKQTDGGKARSLYCTFTALSRKCLIIKGAGEGDRTLRPSFKRAG